MSADPTTNSNSDPPPPSAEATPEPEKSPPSPSKTFDARSALVGIAAGVVAGAAIGVTVALPIQPENGQPAFARVADRPDGGGGRGAHPPEPSTPSYAEQGEDLIMLQMLVSRGIRQPSYLDVGARDPVVNSKSYWFYKLGGRGVLVEPNPAAAKRLHAIRSKDVVLEVGVGVADEEADYYMIEGARALDTFSKKKVDALVNEQHRKVERTIKRKVVKLEGILAENFKEGSPHILTLDTDGNEYEVLKTLDWTKWRPLLVCVRTADANGKLERPIFDLMEKNGYVARGGSYLNTVFLDEQPSAAAPVKPAPAPSR